MNMRSSEELSVLISCSCNGWLSKTDDEDVYECAKCKTPYMREDVERLESMVRLHGVNNLWVEYTQKALGLNAVETALAANMKEEMPLSAASK